MKPATDLIHRGETDPATARPLATPIYATSTFVFESAQQLVEYHEGKQPLYMYSRYENPTVVAAERKVAAVDGAEAALAFSSGMAAISSAVLALVGAGDEVVCSSAIYGGTFHFLNDFLARFGVTTRFVTLEEMQAPGTVIGPKTKVFWFESPINPTLRCVDVAAIAAACRVRGVLSAIDNTFANPVNQPVLAMGVDLSMQSATKYLNGHSDITAGVVSGSIALMRRIEPVRRLLGGILDPQPAYALARGLKTLTLRMAQHNANGLAVARALESHPAVARVFYPGLPSHPDHALASRQMRGFGGMVCLDLKGGYEAACRMYDRVQLFRRAASLGGVESLLSLPVLTSQYGLSDEDLVAAGISKGMVRLSVGLEDAQDLVGDLEQALR